LRTYLELVEQSFEWPTKEFDIEQGSLHFQGIDLHQIIEQFQTPLKLTYLPKISENIRSMEAYFANAIRKYNYGGDYTYCYCTKSSHFSFVLKEILKCGSHLETSSAFDLQIINSLYQQGLVTKDHYIICNGFKRPLYTDYITKLLNNGFKRCIPILDNLEEFHIYEKDVKVPYEMGIRIASDEAPNFEFYTSRLGVRYSDVEDFYKTHVSKSEKARLRMLHFFVNTGIKDSAYYWSELSRFMYTYCKLKKVCPELNAVDIGGGFPIKTSLTFEFDYQYMVDQIVENIQWICQKNHVPVPDIFTEFGSYTVGESGATLYSILGEKLQNDKELWYMIDGSFITQLPDTWGLSQKFVLLPINNWKEEFHKVNLGGLTCDSMDYYDSEAHRSEVILPRIPKKGKQFIGFFHTGAYQDALGGYGGIQHCLIPAPKHVIVDKEESGEYSFQLFAPDQSYESMMTILGYHSNDPEYIFKSESQHDLSKELK
jgi:arginine decarboxylase